ncbi:hypothetical protein KQX54_018330 [Cotesia glomerata]|uniref:Uncharacterized protein n=1 Tax=Cotesia glomerata TaxID=32391 RepID=A0AAV7J5S0_COTGL|nr:hypothetical protein KQX54_018330 [Cotesia glomerata]
MGCKEKDDKSSQSGKITPAPHKDLKNDKSGKITPAPHKDLKNDKSDKTTSAEVKGPTDDNSDKNVHPNINTSKRYLANVEDIKKSQRKLRNLQKMHRKLERKLENNNKALKSVGSLLKIHETNRNEDSEEVIEVEQSEELLEGAKEELSEQDGLETDLRIKLLEKYEEKKQLYKVRAIQRRMLKESEWKVRDFLKAEKEAEEKRLREKWERDEAKKKRKNHERIEKHRREEELLKSPVRNSESYGHHQCRQRRQRRFSGKNNFRIQRSRSRRSDSREYQQNQYEGDREYRQRENRNRRSPSPPYQQDLRKRYRENWNRRSRTPEPESSYCCDNYNKNRGGCCRQYGSKVEFHDSNRHSCCYTNCCGSNKIKKKMSNNSRARAAAFREYRDASYYTHTFHRHH